MDCMEISYNPYYNWMFSGTAVNLFIWCGFDQLSAFSDCLMFYRFLWICGETKASNFGYWNFNIFCSNYFDLNNDSTKCFFKRILFIALISTFSDLISFLKTFPYQQLPRTNSKHFHRHHHISNQLKKRSKKNIHQPQKIPYNWYWHFYCFLFPHSNIVFSHARLCK